MFNRYNYLRHLVAKKKQINFLICKSVTIQDKTSVIFHLQKNMRSINLSLMNYSFQVQKL
jgi:hypothetical protein